MARPGSAWWPQGRVAQKTLGLALHHRVDAGAGGTDATHHCFPRAGRHHGVTTVERGKAVCGRQFGDFIDEGRIMNQFDLRARAQRCLAPFDIRKGWRAQRRQHRLQALGRLRMMVAGPVVEAGVVGVHNGGHGAPG
jgi:hypothetical protein